MHPVVSEYINTNKRLVLVLEEKRDTKQPLEEAVYQLYKKGFGFEWKEEDLAQYDEALIQGHPDPEAYVLLISVVLGALSDSNKRDRSSISYSILKDINTDKMHPTLLAIYYINLATYLYHHKKDPLFLEYMQKAINSTDSTSKRFYLIILLALVILCNIGYLKYLAKYSKHIPYHELSGIELNALAELELDNSIFVIDISKAKQAFESFQKYYSIVYKKNDRLDRRHDILLLMQNQFDSLDYKNSFIAKYAKCCELLLQKKFKEALALYESDKEDMNHILSNIIYARYFLLNVELNLCNKGKARLLLTEMQDELDIYYFDNLFWARLFLLEKQYNKAREAFQKLMTNVKRFGSEGRLLYELQFVKELSLYDFYRMYQNLAPSLELTTEANTEKNNETNDILIGKSTALKKIKENIKTYAEVREPILIIGETGTGKELVARAIHQAGKDAKQPFLAINCSSLTDTLLESELFGYEAGAFTGALREKKGFFEAAGRGTVFLDEFGSISNRMQASLLRVLEYYEVRRVGSSKTRKIECRIIVASNVNLKEAVETQKFREDLYFRLKRFDVHLPPLRERADDIPLLVTHFLKADPEKQQVAKKLSSELLEHLQKYSWPGNIRELKNEIDRLSILYGDKNIIQLEDFDFSRLQNYMIKLPKQMEPNTIEKEKSVFINQSIEEKALQVLKKGNKIERRRNDLALLFKKHQQLTRLQVIEILGISPSTATADLEDLCKKGLIRKVMPNKSVRTHYFENINSESI